MYLSVIRAIRIIRAIRDLDHTQFLANLLESLQPDIQYIINPNGFLDDALALGVRAEISF